MKRWLKTAAGVLVVLAIGGFLVAASGLVPIGASSGHWPVTRWMLRFGMERSTATHSLGVDVPRLDDPGLVLKGAGHYEIGCRSCHGAPGGSRPAIARAMTPQPPELVPRIRESNPQKLFYVVKHGIKFTGMPAWPSQKRDDEVWAMVAFLLELPEMDADRYRRLVHGDAVKTIPDRVMSPAPPAVEIPAAIAQTCARCHGEDGEGRGTGAFPRLAGQRRVYLENTLHAYARGERNSGIMEPVAGGLTEKLIRELAGYYATLEPSPEPVENQAAHGNDDDLIARGRQIAERGIPAHRVPSCIDCHGPKGSKTKPAYPSLAGQYADYLELQLQLFKKDQRGGSEYAHLMHEVVHGLQPEDIRAVARFFASIPPHRHEPSSDNSAPASQHPPLSP